MEPAKRIPGQNLHLYGFKHEESEVWNITVMDVYVSWGLGVCKCVFVC